MKMKFVVIFLSILFLFFSCKSNSNKDSKSDKFKNFSSTKNINLIMNVEEKKELSLTRAILNGRVLNFVSIYIYGAKFKVDKKGKISIIVDENLNFNDYTLSNVIINNILLNNNNYYVQEFSLKYNLNLNKYSNYKFRGNFEIQNSGKDITLIFNDMLIKAIKKLNKRSIEGIIIPSGDFIYEKNDLGFTLKEKFFIYY